MFPNTALIISSIPPTVTSSATPSRVKRLLATAQAGGASEDPVLHLMMAQTCLGLGKWLRQSYILLYALDNRRVQSIHTLIVWPWPQHKLSFYSFLSLGELEECSKEAQKVIVRYDTILHTTTQNNTTSLALLYRYFYYIFHHFLFSSIFCLTTF